jgi:hypothetical protein
VPFFVSKMVIPSVNRERNLRGSRKMINLRNGSFVNKLFSDNHTALPVIDLITVLALNPPGNSAGRLVLSQENWK